MVESLPPGTTRERARRLLERVSYRADCFELRAALQELGAEALATTGRRHVLRLADELSALIRACRTCGRELDLRETCDTLRCPEHRQQRDWLILNSKARVVGRGQVTKMRPTHLRSALPRAT
jgi:hypothetical protein